MPGARAQRRPQPKSFVLVPRQGGATQGAPGRSRRQLRRLTSYNVCYTKLLRNYHDRHDDYITRGYTEHFQKWGQSDLTRTVLRDRNHPSIVQWSIGNEIEWTYLNYRYVTGFWTDPNDPQDSGDYWGSAPIHTP